MKLNQLFDLTRENIHKTISNDPMLFAAFDHDKGRSIPTIAAAYSCKRFRAVLEGQGVAIERKYELSTIARITEVKISSDRCALRLSMPVWDRSRSMLHTIVTLPVAFDLNTKNPPEYPVGGFVRLNYSILSDFTIPATEFRVEPPKLLGFTSVEQIEQLCH